jgi:glyoxylase-like metal-dependent hydrolase (beta-lactamase superfamily II)/rhodanese-related sulfurtransferase
MDIEQFEDSDLAHYSYAISSEGLVALIDPARDPQPYYNLVEKLQARIVAVIETHPHADFVSSHLEIHRQTGAPIYCSSLTGAAYPSQPFEEGREIQLGDATLRALDTPGHSPDSISVVLSDTKDHDHAVFTGDCLFVGDCGRPDLREETGAIHRRREDLARQQYHSLRKLLNLRDDVIVYPAHGSGSLCGRSLSTQKHSTIGAEKISNWSLQPITETDFIAGLLENQPFVPRYFSYNVEVNRKGAPDFKASIAQVHVGDSIDDAGALKRLTPGITIVDTRPQQHYKQAHAENSINLQIGPKFETWLGSLLAPEEKFYLATGQRDEIPVLLGRIAKIGYEGFIQEAFVLRYGDKTIPPLDLLAFKNDPDRFRIIDVRNPEERGNVWFDHTIAIPLPSLRDRIEEIPLDKPLVVHCATGYRSAAAASILSDILGNKADVFDLGSAINKFQSHTSIPQ